jgi:dienelactone hydrolase
MSNNSAAQLPDLFRFKNGDQVRTPEDWRRRRGELRALLLEIEYGELPPVGEALKGELLHRGGVRRYDGARLWQYRLLCGEGHKVRFRLDIFAPKEGDRFPVILNGDGCWRYLTDEIILAAVRRGFAIAQFSRVEIAPDNYTSERDMGIYLASPEGEYGAIAAWAWGYSRCVDFFQTLDFIDAKKIAITGHSRGGKAVLLAGALDERIAVTAPNCSGCGGAGSFFVQGEGSETLADILKAVPYWFSPRLKDYIKRQTELPFDQHALKALVAPRALFGTEALEDLWANLSGTWQTHLAAREAYRFLSAEDKIAIRYREGIHEHNLADWNDFMDFAQWQFGGTRPERIYGACPLPETAPVFSWRAPV